MDKAHEWLALKSGSDIRGRTDDNDISQPHLTEELTQCVASAFAEKLAAESGKSSDKLVIAVGRDPRLSGEKLSAAAIRGVSTAGATAVDCGLCTTPAMFMSTLPDFLGADGAVMITASHMPPHMNGIKLITQHGGLTSAEIEKILISASAIGGNNGTGTYRSAPGPVRKTDILPRYCETLRSVIGKYLNDASARPLAGLHVAVDAGNGSGGFYAAFLQELGADITGSIYLEPDGRFPNHIPNPELPEPMHALSEAVVRNRADIGVIFDADCDRAAFSDPYGIPVHRNRLIALVSSMLLTDTPGATIVTDSVTSTGLTDFITAHGGFHRRFKRGYRNVIDESIRLNSLGRNCPLAIETSGHAAFRDHYNLDDGMYLATLLICQALQYKQKGRCFISAVDGLREPLEEEEIRLPVLSPDLKETGDRAIRRIAEAVSGITFLNIPADNEEGIRVHADFYGGHDNAWFLLRLSLHEPLLPLNIESDVVGGVARLKEIIAEALEGCEGVDISALLKGRQDQRR